MQFAALDPIRVGEPSGIFQTWKKQPQEIFMRTVEDARKALGLAGKRRANLPPEVRLFGEFMVRQQNRKLTARDIVKAYVVTMSSIQRQGIGVEKLLTKWPSGSQPPVAVLTEMSLPGRPPRTFEAYTTAIKRGQSAPKVRPETYMAALLLSPVGTRYLDAAERGEFDHSAAIVLSEAHRPFGKSGLDESGQPSTDSRKHGLYQQLRDAVLLGQRYRDVAYALRKLPAADWAKWVKKNIKGVDTAKPGFFASLLGRGDLPTADAREIDFWWTNWRDFSSQIVEDGVPKWNRDGTPKLRAPPVKTEFVLALADRLRALNVQMPLHMRRHYQHLVHHMVWDAAGGSHTTHADVVAAMELAGVRRYR